MKTIAGALSLLALAAPAALATEFPGNENPRCTYEVPAKMKRNAALSSGISVQVSCDGPAKAASILIVESRRQRTRWENLHNHGIPGISNSDVLTFEAAGTQTLRVNILPKEVLPALREDPVPRGARRAAQAAVLHERGQRKGHHRRALRLWPVPRLGGLLRFGGGAGAFRGSGPFA
jgi:hypothetical protein